MGLWGFGADPAVFTRRIEAIPPVDSDSLSENATECPMLCCPKEKSRPANRVKTSEEKEPTMDS